MKTRRTTSCLTGHNREWAERAPVLVLSVGKRHFDAGGRVNHYVGHDVGLATENLVIQATALQLFVHLMAGFDAAQARKLFAAPETHEPVCVFTIGYFGDLEALSPDMRTRELSASPEAF